MSDGRILKYEEITDVQVDVSALCSLFNVSPQYLGRLVELGIVSKSAHGAYPLAANVSGYIAHIKSKRVSEPNGDGDEEIDNTRERGMLMRAQREKVELEKAEKAGLLIPMSVAQQVYGDFVTSVKTNLRGLPARLAPMLANKQPADIQEMLSETIDEALSSFDAQEESIAE